MKFKLIDKYILRKFLTTYFAAMGFIIILIIVFDISEKLDDFIEKQAPLLEIIFKYYINFVPSFINDYSPLFTFISVVFFTSKLASNTEIIAILSSGISFKRMLRPYIYGSVLIAVLTFCLGNFLIPYMNIDRLLFERKYINNPYRNKFQHIHIQMNNTVQIYVTNFDNNDNIGTEFSYEKFKNNEIFEKFTAQEIIYDTITKKWTATNYTKRTIKGLNENLYKGESTILDMGFTPKDFNINRKDAITLNLPQLTRLIEQEKKRGSHLVKEYEIMNYQRIINPIASIIMTFIAVTVSFRKQRGGVGFNLALGLLIAFAFVIFMKFSTVFSIKGNLPPFISVIIPPAFFGIIAYFLVRKAPK